MAQAIEEVRDASAYNRADAALDAALPLILRCVAEHGVATAFDIAAGRDPRRHAVDRALRGMGAAE